MGIAAQLYDAIPNAMGDEKAQAELMAQITKHYGDEKTFFQATADELGVSPESVSSTVMKIGQSKPTEEQPMMQQPVSQPMNNPMTSAPPQQSQAPMQKPMQTPPVTSPNTQPPKQLNPMAMQQKSTTLQASGMAQGQAQNQAAQSPTTQMGYKKGGFVKPPSAPELNKQVASYKGEVPEFAMKAGQKAGIKERLVRKPMMEKVPLSDKQDVNFGANEKGYSTSVSDAIQTKQTASRDQAFEDSDERILAEEGLPPKKYAEGGEVDLPMTSPEEEADDVPARLSEGEFVIPAYAVKYFGVSKLNEMLEEARIKMEELEGAGMEPDDVSAEEPVMEQEVEQEFARGGSVKAPKIGKPEGMSSKSSAFKAPKSSISKTKQTGPKVTASVPRGPNIMPYALKSGGVRQKFKTGGYVNRMKSGDC